MDIKITPSKLSGKLIVPPSKSISHGFLRRYDAYR